MTRLLLCAVICAAATADLDEVVRRCGDRDLAVREAAFGELREQATIDDLPVLADALRTSGAGRSRTRVARVIGRLDDDACVAPLAGALATDKSEHVRAAAAHALGDLRRRQAVEPLIEAMTGDATTRVRMRAAASLGMIGTSQAKAALLEAAKSDKEWAVRRAIRWILDDRGPAVSRPARLKPGEITEGVLHGTRYDVYVPKDYRGRTERDLLVVVHGTNGHSRGYLEMCLADAERRGLVVVAPWFDWPTFPNFGMLNPGWDNVRADLRLMEIVDAVAGRVKVRADRFLLFGHSQGGAFVQRFMLAHPDRVRRAAASAANSFAKCDAGLAFPYGTGPNPTLPDLAPDCDAYVATPMLVVVGARDEKRFLDAARGMTDASRRHAELSDAACRIELREVPGGGHDGRSNYKASRGFLLGDG